MATPGSFYTGISCLKNRGWSKGPHGAKTLTGPIYSFRLSNIGIFPKYTLYVLRLLWTHNMPRTLMFELVLPAAITVTFVLLKNMLNRGYKKNRCARRDKKIQTIASQKFSCSCPFQSFALGFYRLVPKRRLVTVCLFLSQRAHMSF